MFFPPLFLAGIRQRHLAMTRPARKAGALQVRGGKECEYRGTRQPRALLRRQRTRSLPVWNRSRTATSLDQVPATAPRPPLHAHADECRRGPLHAIELHLGRALLPATWADLILALSEHPPTSRTRTGATAGGCPSIPRATFPCLDHTGPLSGSHPRLRIQMAA